MSLRSKHSISFVLLSLLSIIIAFYFLIQTSSNIWVRSNTRKEKKRKIIIDGGPISSLVFAILPEAVFVKSDA
jgi:hypothetical protein